VNTIIKVGGAMMVWIQQGTTLWRLFPAIPFLEPLRKAFAQTVVTGGQFLKNLTDALQLGHVPPVYMWITRCAITVQSLPFPC
jgi:hypothetical protein